MTTHTFKVGDRVRIRQWDDMEREFGTDSSSRCSICTRTGFVLSMSNLCGTEATINSIDGDEVELTNFSAIDCDTNWVFDIDMFEPVAAQIETKQSKWTPEPAKYHNGDNWFTKEKVCIDGKEMTVEEFKAATTLYRSALSAYNKYFPKS